MDCNCYPLLTKFEPCQEIGTDLEKEIKNGYSFGFSLAGLDKLRKKKVSTDDMSKLFKLPTDRVAQEGDGNAHLMGSLKEGAIGKGRVWNIALGTGVGFGITNSKQEIKPSDELKKFFGCHGWEAKDPETGKDVWEAGSGPAFDKLKAKHNDEIDKAIADFATRWARFINEQILEKSKGDKEWAKPQHIVFTGGHTEHNSEKLVKALKGKVPGVEIHQGPKEAGLVGAAWLALSTKKK